LRTLSISDFRSAQVSARNICNPDMQIDGHHTATYVAARIAGFSHDEAAKIAYAAQYVDDATNEGTIEFLDSPYMYARIASAHRMIDYQNLMAMQNHLAWIPFHFLPGNEGLLAGQEPSQGARRKLICRPDSPVARDMLKAAMEDIGSARELHRLGVTMHVYADTFAHQGFVGSIDAANVVINARSDHPETDRAIATATRRALLKSLRGQWMAFWALVLYSFESAWYEHEWPLAYWRHFLSKTPLGHAKADTYPDQPYLKWSYTDCAGKVVERDNPKTFLQAMHMMVRAMRAWRARDFSVDLAKYEGLPLADEKVVDRLFRSLKNPEGPLRQAEWAKAIAAGEFSFGPAIVTYIGKGEGSWKHRALGTTADTDSGYERYPFSKEFITSDWKLFHDAIQVHRNAIVRDVLPRYGICAA